MKAFFQAVQTLFETTNPFNTALSGSFYFGLDEGSNYPYATYFCPPGMADGDWSTDIDDDSLQINCYAETSKIAIDLFTKCRTLFDGASLTVTGYQDVKLKLGMFTPPYKDGDRWAVVLEFQFYLIKE